MKYIIENINNYSNDDYKNFYSLIKKAKKERIDKYIKEEDKKRSILGEKILKDLLLEENIIYEDIIIETNENGKPFIKNNEKYYNISHSNDYVVVAISDKPIGVDIEKIKETSISVINKIAKEKEKQYILSNKEEIEKRLFEIYTLKEAYLKMNGLSLKDINKIEFTIEKNKISCSNKKTKAKIVYNLPKYIISICEKL